MYVLLADLSVAPPPPPPPPHATGRFIGRILQKFHEEVQRRLDAEASLKRRLGQAQRQMAANQRKANVAQAEADARAAMQAEVIAGLNFSLNKVQVELQEMQRCFGPLRSRRHGRRIGASGRPMNTPSVRSSHSNVGVKMLSVKELRMQQ